MLALVPVATANLTGIGIGSVPLLYDSIALPRLAVAVVLCAAAWAAHWFGMRRDGAVLRVDPTWLFLVALAAWSAISAAVSDHPRFAVLGQSEWLEGVVTFVLYAALYGLGLEVVRSGRDLRRLAAAFAGSAAFLSVYGLVQFAGLDPASWEWEGYGFDLHRAFATLGNPNFLGGVLVLAFPISAALAYSSSERRTRFLWSAAALLNALAVFATFTRGSWIALLLELTIGAWILARNGAFGRVRWARVALALAAFAVVVFVSLSSAGETNVLERLKTAGGGSTTERILVTRIALDATAARPLTGYGPDAFLAAFRAHRSDDYARVFGETHTINNSHSWPFQIMATLGIPGLLLLAAALLSALWASRRSLSSARERSNSSLATAIWVASAGFAVHMMLNVAVLASSVPFWLLLGALGASSARRTVRIPAGVRDAAVGLSAVLAVVVLAGAVMLVAADAAYVSSRLAFLGMRQGDAEGLAKRAASLNPLSIKYARGYAEAAADKVYVSMRSGADGATVKQQYLHACSCFERALAVDSHDYASLAWYAALQGAVGDYTGDQDLKGSAVVVATRAIKLDRQASQIRPLAGLGADGGVSGVANEKSSAGDTNAAYAKALTISPWP